MKPLFVVVFVGIAAFAAYSFSNTVLHADEQSLDPTTKGVVRVRVIDDRSTTIETATVSVRSEDNKTATTITSADATGSYIFQLPPATYDVVATVPNHKIASRSITLAASQVLQLTLEPTAR